MGFCTQCGAQNSPANKFCTNCGIPLVTAAQGPATASVGSSTREHTQHVLLRQLVLGAMGMYAAGTALAGMGGNAVGAVLSFGLAAAIYFLPHQKLQAHDYPGAKNGCLGTAAVAGVYLVINGAFQSIGGVLFNAVAGGLLVYAYSLLSKE